MKALFPSSVSLVILLTSTPPVSNAQWVPTHGPYGGTTVSSLTVSGGAVFAGTGGGIGGGGGVSVSTDHGQSWTYIGGVSQGVGALAASENTLAAGTDGNGDYFMPGIFIWTKSGDRWTLSSTGLVPQAVMAIAFSGGSLIAGSNYGISVSTDNGASWASVASSPSWVSSVVVVDSFLLAGSANGIYRSTDNGLHWSVASASLVYVYSLAVAGNRVFAVSSLGLFVSTNSGMSWPDSPLVRRNIYSLLVDSGDLYAGSDSGAIVSTDEGVTWAGIGPTSTPIGALAVQDSTIYSASAFSTPPRLFISTNRGSSWNVTGGVETASVAAMTSIGNDLFAAANGRVFISSDEGNTWLDRGISNTSVSTIIASRFRLLAAGSSSANNVFVSSDEGQTWKGSGLAHKVVTSIAATDSDVYVGVWGEGIYHARQNDTAWNSINSGMTNDYPNCLALSGGNLFAGTSLGGVFLSTNKGATWTTVSSGLKYSSVGSLAVKGNCLFAGVFDDASASFSLEVSTDNGNSWAVADSGLPAADSAYSNQRVTAFAVCGDDLFTFVSNQGVFLSTNNGRGWINVSTGLTPAPRGSSFVVGQNLYLGGSGVWKRPLSEMIASVGTPSSGHPGFFRLDQNFPNPFNPSTTIQYALAQRLHVTLSVYNILGQLVTTLVNGEEEPGYHEVKFDGSPLASGVYFYRMQAGSFVKTMKMLILH